MCKKEIKSSVHYKILQCGGVEKLIKKRNDRTQEPVYFVHIEDMFDTLKRAHIATGHGGRDKMVNDLSRYANVTRDTVELFKSLCLVSTKTEEMCYQGCYCQTDLIKGLWLKSPSGSC